MPQWRALDHWLTLARECAIASHIESAGDGGCEVVCLCPRAYVPPNNTDDASSSWGNTTDDASSCETHNGDSTTADSPDELARIARHLAANVNVAELEAPCNQCVPKYMPDATRV